MIRLVGACQQEEETVRNFKIGSFKNTIKVSGAIEAITPRKPERSHP